MALLPRRAGQCTGHRLWGGPHRAGAIQLGARLSPLTGSPLSTPRFAGVRDGSAPAAGRIQMAVTRTSGPAGCRRVLEPRPRPVAVDSPMYPDRRAQAQAKARSARYYANAGFAELAEHYHPIDVRSLRAALADTGFAVMRLDVGGSGVRWWERWRLGPSFLMARLDRGQA